MVRVGSSHRKEKVSFVTVVIHFVVGMIVAVDLDAFLMNIYVASHALTMVGNWQMMTSFVIQDCAVFVKGSFINLASISVSGAILVVSNSRSQRLTCDDACCVMAVFAAMRIVGGMVTFAYVAALRIKEASFMSMPSLPFWLNPLATFAYYKGC